MNSSNWAYTGANRSFRIANIVDQVETASFESTLFAHASTLVCPAAGKGSFAPQCEKKHIMTCALCKNKSFCASAVHQRTPLIHELPATIFIRLCGLKSLLGAHCVRYIFLCCGSVSITLRKQACSVILNFLPPKK